MAYASPGGLSKYQHVASELRARINSGALAPGDPLPPEPELEREFGFNRGTIRQAISVLRQEGLIDVVHGRGTFVRKRRLIRRDVAAGLRNEHVHMRGEVPEKDLFAALTGTAGDIDVPTTYDTVPANEELAEAFGIEVGSLLLRRHYLFIVDGSPHQVVDSYLRLDMVEGSPLVDPRNERPNRGTMAQLASIDIIVDHVDVVFRARLATMEEASTLAIAPGMAVFASKRVMFSEGRAVEVGSGIAPGDVLELLVPVELGGGK